VIVLVKEITLDKIDFKCVECGGIVFDGHNGHCDGIHTILLKCKNKSCNYEMVISDGMLVGKDGTLT